MKVRREDSQNIGVSKMGKFERKNLTKVACGYDLESAKDLETSSNGMKQNNQHDT